MSRDTFNYTAAPWTAVYEPASYEDDKGGFRIDAEGIEQVAFIWNENMRHGSDELFGTKEAACDARLIAASPELYEALALILPLAKGYAAAHPVGSNDAYIEHAEALIRRLEYVTEESTI